MQYSFSHHIIKLPWDGGIDGLGLFDYDDGDERYVNLYTSVDSTRRHGKVLSCRMRLRHARGLRVVMTIGLESIRFLRHLYEVIEKLGPAGRSIA